MKHVCKALFVVGLCVIFSVLGIDFSEHDAPAKALAILAVGYLVFAAGQAVQSFNVASHFNERDGLL